METFGSIIDKICILERRISELKKQDKNYYHLYNQYGWLLKALGDYLVDSFDGKRPFTFAKNKLYDNDINIEDDISLMKSIERLNIYNNTLWDLEDKRRDKSLSAEERLEAADNVANYNKLRNDAMDKIDENIEKAASCSHYKFYLEKEGS